jgi:hypothetical protein
MRVNQKFGYWLLCGVASALTACGGGGSGGGSSALGISGLAATGAGIANASVTAKCATGTPLTGTTDANGSYNLVLDGRTLPCMVQVTGGTPSVTLHSFAQAAGRVNITPVTDLIVAKALGSDPATAFTGYVAANGTTIETGLAAAKTYVSTQINAITGGTIADPLTGAFSVGDADDKVLDALGNAMSAAGKTIAHLRTAAQSGDTLTGTVPAYLAAPAGLTATASGSSTINLSWTAVPGATGYKVFRGSSTGVVTSGTADAAPTSTTYSDTGLTASTTYYYKVVATNSVVTAGGSASTAASATTDGASSTMAVSAFSPTSGASDTNVTITGTGFDADPFHMQVKFSNNVTASVVSSSSTSMVVTVPAGAVTGPITVTNTLTNASSTSADSFTVTGGGSGGGSSTWVSRASPSGWLLNGLAYGNSTFVAVGYSRTIITSSDGISWTTRTASDANYYENKAVAWNGSVFILGGDMVYGSSSIPVVATSPDGVTWTRRTWTADTSYDTVSAVGVGAGKTMIGTTSGVLAYTTNDGATWTTESQSHIAQFNGFAGNNTTRVAVGKNSSNQGVILYDTGSGWTKVAGLSGIVPRAVVWTGSKFVAVGGSMAGLADAASATSTDGVTWTVHALSSSEAPAGHSLTTVLSSGSTLYATGDNLQTKHIIVQSTDGGATWSSAYSGTVSGIASLMGIAASSTRIVTVGGVKSVTLP